MFNKKFLIILTLLLSIFLVLSSVSAEEIASDDVNVEIEDLNDDQLSVDEDSLEVLDLESSDIEEINLEGKDPILSDSNDDVNTDIGKYKLTESSTSDLGNQVTISDVSVYENKDIIIKINSNYVGDYDTGYTIDVTDSDGVNVVGYNDYIPSGNHTTEINLGPLGLGNYKLTFTDDYGLTCVSNIKVLRMNAKITVSNYTSYYKSGKTVNIKTIDKSNNKPISMKVKLVFKKTGTKAKTYYVTTNSSGVAKFKVNLGWGTYKLTVTSANSKINTNKAGATVKISKMPIKITVPNYSSFYKSGKKLSIKVINKKTNKGVSVKLKFVYKKPKAKAKVYYVTTNAKGVAKIKIPVGIGKYKLTVKPTISSFKANKVSKKVNVNKYVIFKAGKYRGKLTYKQVLALKKAKANGKDLDYKVFTGRYYSFKTPIYKEVKVKKTKWVYKHVVSSEDYWDSDFNDYTTYDYSLDKYWDNGWTWYGSYYKEYDNGHHVKYYSKFKKKVSYWDTEYVKTGKYRKGKDKIYMTVSTNSGKGQYPKGDLIEVWSSEYWDKYLESIITKTIKI